MVLVGFYYSMGQITVCFDLLLDSLLKKGEKVAFFFFFSFLHVSQSCKKVKLWKEMKCQGESKRFRKSLVEKTLEILQVELSRIN